MTQDTPALNPARAKANLEDIARAAELLHLYPVAGDPDPSRDNEVDPVVRFLLPGNHFAGIVLQDLAAAEDFTEILFVKGLKLRDLPKCLDDLAGFLKCLHAASEVAGFAKTGGLADVAGSLPIALTQREAAILRELALARGRAVSRETLMDRVWGPGETPSDGAIEYQIHGLRQKLGSQRICTLRGVGGVLLGGARAVAAPAGLVGVAGAGGLNPPGRAVWPPRRWPSRVMPWRACKVRLAGDGVARHLAGASLSGTRLLVLETVALDDLRDPALVQESRSALDELTQILKLGSVYPFQR